MHQPRFRRECPVGWLAVSLLSGAALVYAQPATITGSISVGATKVTPRAVAAVGYTAPNGRLISVLVSDKPADCKEFLERTTVGAGESLMSGIFEGAWKGLHLEKALSGFVFTLNSDRRIVGNEFLIGGDAFSLSADDLVLELTSVTPRLAGRIRTTVPTVEVGSYKAGLDVTFDVQVDQPGK